jgi:hypothetical protein
MRFKKQTLVICIITLLAFASIAAINSSNEPFKEGVYIEPSLQKPGDIQKGYDYLVNGDYLKSGLGYKYYVLLNGKDRKNYLGRTGKAGKCCLQLQPYQNQKLQKPCSAQLPAMPWPGI